MLIGIDCHNLEGQRTGVGRYLFNLLEQWSKLSPKSLPCRLASLRSGQAGKVPAKGEARQRRQSPKFILYFKNQIPKDIPRGGNFQSKLLKSKSNALFMHYHLCRAATKDKLDILFCPAYIAPVFYKGKIVLTLHDIIYEARPDLYNWPSIFDRILLKKVSKISAKKADIIFTPSNFSKNEIIKYYKINPEKIFVTPLAADKKFTLHHSGEGAGFKNVGGLASHIKKKYGIKEKFVLYIGAVIKRRFVHNTIKAFKFLEKTCPEIIKGYQLLIVGKNHTNQRISQNGIIHKDHVDEDDLVPLYNAADLFIWLSSYEGFGLPPLEALACGTLVITTKMGSLPEAVGSSALFVKNPENINEISEIIYKGLMDKNLRERLIKKGLAQAQKFSWQKTAEETLEILLNQK